MYVEGKWNIVPVKPVYIFFSITLCNCC